MDIIQNCNPTYEDFKEINRYIKTKVKTAFTILDINLNKNSVKVRQHSNKHNETNKWINIESLVMDLIVYQNYYITNISALRNWKGFSTNEYVYLSEILITKVDELIYDENFDYKRNKGLYSVSFKTLESNIDSFILRNKLVYKSECGRIDKNFWYIKSYDKTRGFYIDVLTDKNIYTPINSDSLFMNTHFNYIDLSNVNLSRTKSFCHSFSYCYCSGINFGKNAITKQINTLSFMFSYTPHLVDIDFRDFDLSNIQDISGLCYFSNVKNIYFNKSIKGNIVFTKSALYGTKKLENTNFSDLFSENQRMIMKQSYYD